MSPPRSALLCWLRACVGREAFGRYRLSVGVALAAAVAAALSLAAAAQGRARPAAGSGDPAAGRRRAGSAVIVHAELRRARRAGTQQQEDAAAVKSGFDSRGNPVAAPSTNKSFILDPILQSVIDAELQTGVSGRSDIRNPALNTPMHHFDYRDGVLHAEAVNLVALAEAVGTPFYCYSTATLERHYRVFAGAFADVDALVCYA